MIGDILQPTHLLFILVVALVVLGPKRLPEVGRSLGRGLRDFRNAVSGADHDELADHAPAAEPAAAAGPADTADHTQPAEPTAAADHTAAAAPADHAQPAEPEHVP